MPVIGKLLELIKEKFFAKLEKKTGWGKEQIKQAYIDATNEVLIEYIELTKEGEL